MFPLLIKIFPLFAENISEPAGKIIFRVFLQVPSSLFASLGKPCLIIESVWQTHHNDDDGDDEKLNSFLGYIFKFPLIELVYDILNKMLNEWLALGFGGSYNWVKHSL